MTPYCYFIPHHHILHPESHTTKLRVVFNASATTTARPSQNISLYTGCKLQQDLPQILIRARTHKILFTVDIKQMYRHIEIHQKDHDYLKILWRFERDQPIEEYCLRTVTYGTSCAPHQAFRALQYLAKLEENTYPTATQITMHDTFVDDILTGANISEAALEFQLFQVQLISLFARGHFQLRKWAGNSSVILQSIPECDRSMSTDVLFDDELDARLKILGTWWNPKQDHLFYSAKSPSTKTTKRSILSDLACIFDPLGLLAPTTFLAKHLMQLLWTSGIGWDDPIPELILTIWQRYQCDRQGIQHLSVPCRITMDGEVKYDITWPPSSTLSASDPTNLEIRHTTLLLTSATPNFDQLFLRISSLRTIIRIVAYCILVGVRIKQSTRNLSPMELAHAFEVIVLAIQLNAFPMNLHGSKIQITKVSSNGLNPSIDEREVL